MQDSDGSRFVYCDGHELHNFIFNDSLLINVIIYGKCGITYGISPPKVYIEESSLITQEEVDAALVQEKQTDVK